MFGPKSPNVLIFLKTKTWWENLKKIHLPENRVRFDRDELIQLVKENQLLRMEIRKLQVLHKVPLKEMIDFQKLTKAFFRDHPYYYGKLMQINRSSRFRSQSTGRPNATKTEQP